jgi:hypothetical protein
LVLTNRMVVLAWSLCGFSILTCFAHVYDFSHERVNFHKIAQFYLSFVRWLWNLVIMKLMSLRSCSVSNLLIWTCVASCREFCILEKL